jgi:predicted Zn-dependent protease
VAKITDRGRDTVSPRSSAVFIPIARNPAAGVASALAFGLALLAGCSVNPATGERQLTLISESQEIQMGRQSDEQIVESLGLYPDDELQAYVEGVGRDLAATCERPDLPWTFRVVDDPVVNAFALPGGYIYVTRGILAHLNSEAELAGVLGHEIGHVTGRHAVERLSKAQLAQIGLGVGMAVSEDVARFGDLAQQGLGILFLKFSRDDERQSDDLGVRYMVRAGYDPREMPKVFETLERVSEAQGGSRIPGWLSTHPAPENRVERIADRVPATVSPDAVVARDRYLRRLGGLAYGTDPREGFFQGSTFYHPELRFRLDFPEGWTTSNQKDSVVAVSPDRDAAVVLSLVGGSDVQEAAEEFYRRTGAERNRELRLSLGGLSSVADEFYAQTQQGDMAGIAAFIEYQDRVYQLLGYGPADKYPGRAREMIDAVESFGPVRDPWVLEVEPRRLEIVEVPRPMTLAQLAERYPSTVDVETVALLNAVTPDTRLEAGRLVKRVVGGRLPG